MQSNGKDEDAGSQIARRDKPSLSPTSPGSNLKSVFTEGGNIEKKCQRLLDIGKDQVVDENEELVG